MAQMPAYTSAPPAERLDPYLRHVEPIYETRFRPGETAPTARSDVVVRLEGLNSPVARPTSRPDERLTGRISPLLLATPNPLRVAIHRFGAADPAQAESGS